MTYRDLTSGEKRFHYENAPERNQAITHVFEDGQCDIAQQKYSPFDQFGIADTAFHLRTCLNTKFPSST